MLLFRALMLGLSFTGLCAAVRNLLKLDRFIAPFVTSCIIIITLMLTGMAGALHAGFIALYAAGFAGCAYVLIILREKPDLPLIGLLILFCAWLAWRFLPCPIYHPDDVSHWGLVARWLLENDALPDGSASIVKFQAYPLGSATFIYYIARTLKNAEGMYTLAQHLLMGLSFLPLLSHIRSNRRWLYPAVPVAYAFLFMRSHVIVGLQVDWLLSFMAFGAIASIAYYRDDLKKALSVTIPFLIAIVYIKSSGMFFAACAVVALLIVAKRCGCRPSRRIVIALGGVILFAGAYLLWTLHVKLAYPAGFDSKHAVSLNAYVKEIASKGSTLIVDIAMQMLWFLVKPGLHQLVSIAVFIAIGAALVLGCLLIPGQRTQLHRVMKTLLGCIAMYLCWYAMLFFMYLVSMPSQEAGELASISRYTSTGLTFMVQLAFLILFAFYGREEAVLGKALRRLYMTIAALCVAGVIICLPHSNMSKKLFDRETELSPVRMRLAAADAQLNLPEESRLLIFCLQNVEKEERSYFRTGFNVRYDLRTPHITILSSGTLDSNPEIVFACIADDEVTLLDSPAEYLAENLDDFDAFILIDEDPLFEAEIRAFLETYEGNTPVVFAYPAVSGT